MLAKVFPLPHTHTHTSIPFRLLFAHSPPPSVPPTLSTSSSLNSSTSTYLLPLRLLNLNPNEIFSSSSVCSWPAISSLLKALLVFRDPGLVRSVNFRALCAEPPFKPPGEPGRLFLECLSPLRPRSAQPLSGVHLILPYSLYAFNFARASSCVSADALSEC